MGVQDSHREVHKDIHRRGMSLAWAIGVAMWWITTGPLSEGGHKVYGPFETQELAMQVRVAMFRHARELGLNQPPLWVDEQD